MLFGGSNAAAFMLPDTAHGFLLCFALLCIYASQLVREVLLQNLEVLLNDKSPGVRRELVPTLG